jgi:hypothetical protein
MATLPTNLFCYSILLAMSVAQVQGKKKAPSCDEALKGSLNLKVSKGPEETRGWNLRFAVSRLSQGYPSGPTSPNENV